MSNTLKDTESPTEAQALGYIISVLAGSLIIMFLLPYFVLSFYNVVFLPYTGVEVNYFLMFISVFFVRIIKTLMSGVSISDIEHKMNEIQDESKEVKYLRCKILSDLMWTKILTSSIVWLIIMILIMVIR